MNIILKDITDENFIECTCLTTNKDNRHTIFEEFVASNVFSIAQSKVQDGWFTKVIYDDDTMVGFTMYGFSFKDNFYELCRFMIDHKYQNKGYGYISLLKIIDEMKKFQNCHEIFLSFDPQNDIAKKLYEKVGFKDTGMLNEDEILYKLCI